MTIEVRQMLIKSSVEDDGQASRPQEASAADGGADPQDIERTRLELLAQCKAWLVERLQNQHER